MEKVSGLGRAFAQGAADFLVPALQLAATQGSSVPRRGRPQNPAGGRGSSGRRIGHSAVPVSNERPVKTRAERNLFIDMLPQCCHDRVPNYHQMHGLWYSHIKSGGNLQDRVYPKTVAHLKEHGDRIEKNHVFQIAMSKRGQGFAGATPMASAIAATAFGAGVPAAQPIPTFHSYTPPMVPVGNTTWAPMPGMPPLQQPALPVTVPMGIISGQQHAMAGVPAVHSANPSSSFHQHMIPPSIGKHRPWKNNRGGKGTPRTCRNCRANGITTYLKGIKGGHRCPYKQ